MSDSCAVCSVPADLKCGGCKLVHYCGRDHQKQHWKSGHKTNCKTYKVITSHELGRHAVATRDLKRGEVIMQERPLVLGPKLLTEPICLGCYQRLTLQTEFSEFYKCRGCRWPLCGPKCEQDPWHQAECAMIGPAGRPCPIYGTELASGYSVIVPMRCLMMKKTNPKGYDTLLALEDHLSTRIRTTLYDILRENMVTYLHDQLKLRHIDPDMMMRMCAILDTNSFEIRPPGLGTKVRAIFPETAMLAHDCTPNTRHVFDANMNITVLATVDIPQGQLITVTYTQTLKSTIVRRHHLLDAKCFHCMCARCKDPTELGTYCGSMYCSKCRRGLMVPADALSERSEWHCNADGCDHHMAGRQVQGGNRALSDELDKMERRSPRPLEEWLQKYEETLHPRNTHVLQVKYALIQLYGNVGGFYLHELNKAALERKISLCIELLEVADRVEPGATLFRGKILLDLQQVMTMKTKREFEAELITHAKAQEQLLESMQVLQEAVEILRPEPDMRAVLEGHINRLNAELD